MGLVDGNILATISDWPSGRRLLTGKGGRGRGAFTGELAVGGGSFV